MKKIKKLLSFMVALSLLSTGASAVQTTVTETIDAEVKISAPLTLITTTPHIDMGAVGIINGEEVNGTASFEVTSLNDTNVVEVVVPKTINLTGVGTSTNLTMNTLITNYDTTHFGTPLDAGSNYTMASLDPATNKSIPMAFDVDLSRTLDATESDDAYTGTLTISADFR